MKQPPRRRPTKSTSRPAGLTRINPNAAGIDCGSEEHYVAVPADRDAAPVRSFIRTAAWRPVTDSTVNRERSVSLAHPSAWPTP